MINLTTPYQGGFEVSILTQIGEMKMTNKMETNALPHSVIIEHLDAIQHRAEQLNNKGEIKMENKTDNPEVWALNDYSRSMFDNGEAFVEETDILPHSVIIDHLDAVKHRVEQLNKTGEI